MNLRVAHLADSSPILQADTTSIRHLAGLPRGWEGTYVDFPESHLVTEIPTEKSFRMRTGGLIICSAVAIGFRNYDDTSFGLYLNHTTPTLIQTATANILSAVEIAEQEGYRPVYSETLGPSNDRYNAGHESLRGMMALILDTTLDTIPDSRYTHLTSWDISKVGATFSSSATTQSRPS